jgi:hypothetical protein
VAVGYSICVEAGAKNFQPKSQNRRFRKMIHDDINRYADLGQLDRRIAEHAKGSPIRAPRGKQNTYLDGIALITRPGALVS